ncbi:TPA: hypothetical protein RZK34_001648 [Campylobacter jejuni]|nr:hypothetical protein [Campylobacter jejuni]HEB9330522.1 hypothetical protein [Campylobacter jejuni]
MKIQEKITNALEEWNFDIVKNIYKKDSTSQCRECIDFLYQIGSVDELILLFKDASPIHWNNMYLGSFFEFYNFLIKIQTLSDDEIFDYIKKEKYIPLCINYIISRSILKFCLKKEFVINLLPYVIKNNSSIIFQSFFIKYTIDYFSCMNKTFFCLETRNILTILQENFHTNMTIGARVYYEKFLLNYNFNTFHTQHLKSPKKIALCIGGAMRGVEWELNLKKVIESFQFDVDIFLFTWNSAFLWPGLNGAGGAWAKRLLNENLLNSIPNEIMHKNNLKQYFPNVFFKLNQEYSIQLDVKKLQKIGIFKKIIIKNHEYFIEKYSLDKNNLFINVSKVWYSNYQLLKSVIQYEAENNFQYDFIIKVRPDVEYNINFSIDKLEKLYINDLMIKHHESLYGGLNDNFAAGRRGAMEIYLSLWKYGFLNKSIDFFKNFPNFNSAHNLLQQFCSLMKINCICLESNTIKNFYFVDFIPPNFTKELKLDCKRIKNNIELEKNLSSSIDFLLKYEEYSKKGQLYNMINKSCNHLSYKIGIILIHNSKTFIGVLKIPIKILVCLYHHQHHTKNYYNNHSNAIKESFAYKLGKSFIQASKNWYKGGGIKLIFDIIKLKKNFKKNKK